jgi:hypothetical protein
MIADDDTDDVSLEGRGEKRTGNTCNIMEIITVHCWWITCFRNERSWGGEEEEAKLQRAVRVVG